VTARGAAKSTRWCSVAWQSTGRNFDNKTRGGVRLVAKKVDNNSATWTLLASAFSFSRLCERGNFWWVRAARKRDFLALCFKTARF